MSFPSYRRDFPFFRYHPSLLYFDSAATTQKPDVVLQAMTEFYEMGYAPVHRSIYSQAIAASEQFELVREKVSRFLGANKSSEIIFTKGTTESINLIATCFGKKCISPGDEILLSEMEHHANLVPWQVMAKERNAQLRFIRVTEEGELDLKHFVSLLSRKTKLVTLAHISSLTGAVHPIKKITKQAHEVGAVVVIDGAQSAGHCPIDVKEINCDFFACSAHKMYGPTGLGILYGKEALLDALPPYQFGGNMIDAVSLQESSWNALPMKFEAGTPPIAEVIGLGAAIDYIKDIGLKIIMELERACIAAFCKRAKQCKAMRLLGCPKNRGSLASFIVPGAHPLDLGTLLQLNDIAIRTGHLCCQTGMQRYGCTEAMRVSFALYNSESEMDAFFLQLDQAIDHCLGVS